ncbi:hypothetical protein COEREDRAFT_95843 [Coemansia reversa NRRL 1564]|uniref:Uncharacterized protein n=1 Tax=Coemansia reversa (strain ATCC 12441 / NRRL 1564) TaxID=763665 RepID=A0A2G5BHV8_COERN|nr:hypothetical protein COEREDRAFT_95843 [Coemansia reversa NRRL 1564]|eukprot:PIA18608.1 hypothetical protein COEREDRAFT_95843 [Coemansia reversa NRRL 1564]
MSPPSTPGGPIFSPRQRNPMPWSYRTISLDCPVKRIKLESIESYSMRQSMSPVSPSAGVSRSLSMRAGSLASRRLKRNVLSALPLHISRAAPAVGLAGQSTGLSPIVKGLSLGSARPRNDSPAIAATPVPVSVSEPAPEYTSAPALVATPVPASTPVPLSAVKEKTAPQPMQFRLQKPAPPKHRKLTLPTQKPPAEEKPEPTPVQPQPQAHFRLQKPAPPKHSKLGLGGRKQQQQQQQHTTEKPKTVAPVEDGKTLPQPNQFRLQKAAPTKSNKLTNGGKLKLNVGNTGLISPPSTTSTPRARRGRPPALSLSEALASSDVGMSPLSPAMPHTPGAGGAPPPIDPMSCSLFGEVSPSFYERPTPPPVEGAPVFMFTPPSPAVVLVTGAASADAAEPGSPPPGGLQEGPVIGSSTLSPCTPPWPKSGASLRKTIFDHIGQNQLSPMDLRGYMAISMNS